MAGMPRMNFLFCVLCRKKLMPTSAPMLPPIMDNQKRVSSDMRHFLFRAFRLSTPKIMKVSRLMPMRYITDSRKVISF